MSLPVADQWNRACMLQTVTNILIFMGPYSLRYIVAYSKEQGIGLPFKIHSRLGQVIFKKFGVRNHLAV